MGDAEGMPHHNIGIFNWPVLLNIGWEAARYLKVKPKQIKMHKELEVMSDECKVLVTVVSLE